MRRWRVGALMPVVLAVFSIGAVGAQQLQTVQVFSSPTCGCCTKWAEHVRAGGFTAETTHLADLGPVKARYRVPAHLQSCHTAIVDGYVIEGHVPVADIQRLLRERPAVVGLAVPGMPAGSPGMESPNPVAYDVLAFDAAGRTTVFATHGR